MYFLFNKTGMDAPTGFILKIYAVPGVQAY
jgi:hypothetical protein